jgi:hypothetical protein
VLTDVGQGGQVHIWPYIYGYPTTFLLVENINNKEYVLLLIYILQFFKLQIHSYTLHSWPLADKSMIGAADCTDKKENIPHL